MLSGNQKPRKSWFKKGDKAFLGRHHTEETKIKLSEALKGRISPNKGKTSPWVTKRNLETNHLRSGVNHYNWKGGQTKEERNWQKNRRNRLKQATAGELGGHNYGEWELLKKQYNYTCPSCGLSEPFNQRSQSLTEDHIIPLSKGGSDLIENIQPLCLGCNIKKHAKIIKY